MGEAKPRDSLFDEKVDMGVTVEKFNMHDEVAEGVLIDGIVNTRGRGVIYLLSFLLLS